METILKQYRTTIDYFKKNNFDLSREELPIKMIGDKYFRNEEIDKVNKLKTIKNKYYLDKLNKAIILSKKLKQFKDILLIGVTGSVASGHPKKDDDIDLLIVTKNNSLWKTRVFLKLWLIKNKINHRQKNKPEIKDDFCFNLWLEESYLTIPEAKQNLRNGLDLIMTKVIEDRKEIYQKLLKKNRWANNFVANGYQRLLHKNDEKTKTKQFDLINFACFIFQFFYMLPTKSKELVGLHQAFFHQ